MKINQPIAVLLLIIHMVDIIDRKHYLDFESTGAQSEETESNPDVATVTLFSATRSCLVVASLLAD